MKKSPQFYDAPPVLALEDEPLAVGAETGFDFTVVDLRDTPWRDAAAIQLNMKTVSNQLATGSILLRYAFSLEDLTEVPDAMRRIGTRATTLTMDLPTSIDGDTEREFVSARIPIQARYLCLYWNATESPEAEFDLTVHAIPVD